MDKRNDCVRTGGRSHLQAVLTTRGLKSFCESPFSCLLKILLYLGEIEGTPVSETRNREASSATVDFEWVLEAAFGNSGV